jgi:hypothetical protein
MPESLPWLDPNPMIYATSREGVILSVIFWLTALTLLYFYLYWWRTSKVQPVREQ